MNRDPLWLHRKIQEALVVQFMRHELRYSELDDILEWLDSVLGEEDPDV